MQRGGQDQIVGPQQAIGCAILRPRRDAFRLFAAQRVPDRRRHLQGLIEPRHVRVDDLHEAQLLQITQVGARVVFAVLPRAQQADGGALITACALQRIEHDAEAWIFFDQPHGDQLRQCGMIELGRLAQSAQRQMLVDQSFPVEERGLPPLCGFRNILAFQPAARQLLMIAHQKRKLVQRLIRRSEQACDVIEHVQHGGIEIQLEMPLGCGRNVGECLLVSHSGTVPFCRRPAPSLDRDRGRTGESRSVDRRGRSTHRRSRC